MQTLCKIMSSGNEFDSKTAQRVNGLYYASFNDVPHIKEANLVFYEIQELGKLNLSVTKNKQVLSLKKGSAMKLFNVGTNRYYYAVRLTDQEELKLEELKKETKELKKVDDEIELKVGELLKKKKLIEKSISKIKEKM